MISKGYVIPFRKLPETAIIRNNKSSLIHPVFVHNAIDELLLSGAIIETVRPVTVINPLTVAERNSKLRLVLDLRYINKLVVLDKMRFEGSDTFVQYIEPNSWMFSFDLKSGYHHIQVIPDHWQYLGFSFIDAHGNLRYFCFTVLPFGLCTAGFIFSKVLRQLVKHWRNTGIYIVLFLDDGACIAKDFILAMAHSNAIKRDLLLAGWVPNKSKSHWLPVQSLSWLGFLYDLILGIISATSDKLDNTLLLLYDFADFTEVPVHLVAKLVGKIISLALSHGDIVYLRTRGLQALIASAHEWQ